MREASASNAEGLLDWKRKLCEKHHTNRVQRSPQGVKWTGRADEAKLENRCKICLQNNRSHTRGCEGGVLVIAALELVCIVVDNGFTALSPPSSRNTGIGSGTDPDQ